MARDIFLDVVGMTDTSGNFKPLSNVQVTVYLAGTTTNATIYTGRTGATQKANPFTTLAGGMVEFWAEYGGYDIKFHDLGTPVRITDKTFGWNAVNAEVGGTPSNRITGDGALPYAALDAVSQRQDLPIGAVIDWWRPSNAISVPTGFVVCDGQAVLAANHDFAGGGTINVPDLRNAFVLGAYISNADGAAGVLGDAPSNAPGIRGVGGSQVHTLTAAQSGTPEHQHTMDFPNLGGALPFVPAESPDASRKGLRFGLQGVGGNQPVIQVANNGSHHSGALVAGVVNGAVSASSSHNNTPRYVGLLKIIKVKRN